MLRQLPIIVDTNISPRYDPNVARGRPPLTEEAVQQRIAEYCSRYRVTELNDSAFPVYPAGARETPQHRDWVVLYKAWSRARQRAVAVQGPNTSQCPICLRGFDSGSVA